MMTSEPAAALSGAFGNFQNQNGFWFEMRMLDEGEAYPEPIIPEMRREGIDVYKRQVRRAVRSSARCADTSSM